MFKKLKMQIAARRVEKNKASTRKSKKSPVAKKKTAFWPKVWNVIAWPFRMIGRGISAVWAWIRCIDLIGLVNLTLLCAIIVLFSMLIIDLCGCNKKTIVYVPTPIEQTQKSDSKSVTVTARDKTGTQQVSITLPLKNNVEKNRAAVAKPVKKQCELSGDIVVDGMFPAEKLACSTKINGNLILQNMRQYTLPCGIQINGNLILRDVNMLKFCGDFTITGNIYANRNSSFGPIPKTARLGGQVIL